MTVYQQLQAACKALETAGDHGIAACVSYAMSLVQEQYGVGTDHLAAIINALG